MPDRPAPYHFPKLSLLTKLYYREVFFKGRLLNIFLGVKNNIPLSMVAIFRARGFEEARGLYCISIVLGSYKHFALSI